MIDRRAFLRGVGTTLALPWLPSLARAEGSPSKRLLFFFVPNGIAPNLWVPRDGEGLGDVLSALDPLREHLLLPLGLQNGPGEIADQEEHSVCTASILTNVRPTRDAPHGDVWRGGPSIDQRIAAQLQSGAPYASLQLGSEPEGMCTTPFCGGETAVSWAGQMQPLAKDVSPAVVFQRLFAGSSGTDRAALLRAARGTSVLDAVRTDATQLETRLSTRDRARLDEWFTSVRELEIRTQTPWPACEEASYPAGGQTPADQVREMVDLMVMAVRCHRAPVISYMLGNARSERTYPSLGLHDPHHTMTHMPAEGHGETLTPLLRFAATQYGRLVQALAETPEGDGTLLDQSAVVFYSSMGDGNLHDPVDLPVAIAGSLGGVLKTGQRIDCSGQEVANLWLALARGMGVELGSHGDAGNAPLSSVLA